MESLIASAILMTIVVAVTSAVTAGQQHAFEAQQRIAGSLAAEELIGRIVVGSYDSLTAWNGYTEAVGAMTDMEGAAMPDSYAALGRNVTVTTTLEPIGGAGVQIRGRTVRVRSVDGLGRVLTDLSRFVPEPQS